MDVEAVRRKPHLALTTERRDVPPHAYFVGSALFHYLGPAFAVQLFGHLDLLGVAWLRIATAATAFALWRRPWMFVRDADANVRVLLVAFGVTLAAMNLSFYLAISRLPLGTVGAIEFLGPIALAALGLQTTRNVVALVACMLGVYALTRVTLSGSVAAYAFAFTNCGLFALYVVLGHRIAGSGANKGIDTLAAAMCIALVAITPIGLTGALPAFRNPTVFFAGIVVGLTSSVIPYIFDQLAMARLPRSSFALLLSLLPLTATVVGVVVLHQIPSLRDMAGITLVMIGIALHRVGDSV